MKLPRAGHQRAAGLQVAQHCSLYTCSAGFTEVLTCRCCAVQAGLHAAERPQGLAQAIMLSFAALRLLLCGAAAGVTCDGRIIWHCPAVPDMPPASQATPPGTLAGPSSAGGTPATASLAEADPAGKASSTRGARRRRRRRRKPMGRAAPQSTQFAKVAQGCDRRREACRQVAAGLLAGDSPPNLRATAEAATLTAIGGACSLVGLPLRGADAIVRGIRDAGARLLGCALRR